MLICLLALAVLGFRAPAHNPSDLAQVATVTSDYHGRSHDHHGHLHDGEDEPSAPSGHDHDRFHVGDHSHDTPTAAVLLDFRFTSPEISDPGTRDERVASRPTSPGDRPPRQV